MALVRGEPLPAFQALPPAADRGALVGRPRIDHLVVIDPAVRTAHASTVAMRSSPMRRFRGLDLPTTAGRPPPRRAGARLRDAPPSARRPGDAGPGRGRCARRSPTTCLQV